MIMSWLSKEQRIKNQPTIRWDSGEILGWPHTTGNDPNQGFICGSRDTRRSSSTEIPWVYCLLGRNLPPCYQGQSVYSRTYNSGFRPGSLYIECCNTQYTGLSNRPWSAFVALPQLRKHKVIRYHLFDHLNTSINESMNEWINQSVNQSINQSSKQASFYGT